MDDKRQMTTRLLHHIQQLSLERTFTQVAGDVGRDEKTVRNIFFDHVRNLNNGWMPETPVWLGIDELFLIRSEDPEWTHIEPFKWLLLPHAVAAACALVLGPMQFSDRLRGRCT